MFSRTIEGLMRNLDVSSGAGLSRYKRVGSTLSSRSCIILTVVASMEQACAPRVQSK